jgi:inner membrane transporter RhtA
VHATRAGRRSLIPSAPLLVLGSVISIQVGQAIGKQTFGLVAPAGVVTLRLGFAALLLLGFWRPRLRTDARSIGLVLAFGTAIAGMNLIYPAMQHLPLGVATSLQLLGPLAVAVAGSRRLRDVTWAALACAGIFLIGRSGEAGPLPTTGVLLAVASGAAMGAYLLLSQRAGSATRGGETLALAVTWAALISLPFGIDASGGELLQPQVLTAGLAVAGLSAVLPYSLDLAALRRLPPRTVGVLESLEAVVGALAGLVLLAEVLDTTQWLAVASITAASAGAVGTTRREGPHPPARSPDPAEPDRRAGLKYRRRRR